ncbi:DUF4129 domain-containing protein [Paenarthrobacter sp. Z7-10]|uniref:DUF4129 domain-containing protein n=1 Tax=Paenarthrobacter sp. Z7-10 TaxID=2787635 RepID=UPI0022A9B85D|nr:DUF4129 domain-containing protein [Paenarthrobacter sp. Z7-10]
MMQRCGPVQPGPGTLAILGVLALDVPVQPSGAMARRLAADELAKQVYQQAKPGLAQIILNWVAEFVSDLLDGLNALNANLGLVLLAALVVALVVVAGWLVRPRLNRKLDPSAEVFADAEPLTSAEHRRLAAAAAAAADYPGAVTAQFRALIRGCEERAVFDPQPGRTAHEAADELMHAFGSLAVPLRSAAELFSGVRYGRTLPSRQDFERLRNLDTDVGASSPHYRDQPSATISEL